MSKTERPSGDPWNLLWVAVIGVLMMVGAGVSCARREAAAMAERAAPVTVWRTWDASTGTGVQGQPVDQLTASVMEADRLARRAGLNAGYGAPVPRSAMEAYGVEPRDWHACRVRLGDTSWLMCPDGLVIGS